MSNKKPIKPYRLDKILSLDCEYNLIIGERSNGKSYAIKEYCLKQAYEQNKEFGYVRRWREDIKGAMIEGYFADMDICKITKGAYDCVKVYQSKIYLAYHDDIENKPEHTVRGVCIGYAFCLTGTTHYKSMAFPNMENIILEEFLTDTGYLPNEPTKLLDVVSTILRRGRGKVFMVGNTISRVCPYFVEWQLQGVKNQKVGELQEYVFKTLETDEQGKPVSVKIAVEYTGNSGNNSKMFFGESSKMVTSGVWQTQEYPHLQKDYKRYKKHYSIALISGTFKFIIDMLQDLETKELILFIYPLTTDNIPKRVISDDFNSSIYYTPKLTNVTKYDKLLKELYDSNKVCYSDNLCGSDFNNTIKSRGGL